MFIILIYPVRVNGIRTINPTELNKVFRLKFCVGSRIRQGTPEEFQRTHCPKRCENNNKDEDSSPNTFNDISYQASSKNI